MKVTAEQVKEAAHKVGHAYDIPHHDCGLCGAWVKYSVHPADDTVYFHPGCNCSWSPPEQRSYYELADWVNMQNDEWSEKHWKAISEPAS